MCVSTPKMQPRSRYFLVKTISFPPNSFKNNVWEQARSLDLALAGHCMIKVRNMNIYLQLYISVKCRNVAKYSG